MPARKQIRTNQDRTRRIASFRKGNEDRELQALLRTADEPEGVVVTGPDGRQYFLTREQTRQSAVRGGGLYQAYLLLTQGRNPPPARTSIQCRRAKRWLDSHSPNSARWRKVCLLYFDQCV